PLVNHRVAEVVTAAGTDADDCFAAEIDCRHEAWQSLRWAAEAAVETSANGVRRVHENRGADEVFRHALREARVRPRQLDGSSDLFVGCRRLRSEERRGGE